MEDNAELESFRNQWKEEVKARTRHEPAAKQKREPSAAAPSEPYSISSIPPLAVDRRIAEDDELLPRGSKEEIVEKTASLRLGDADDDVFNNNKEPQKEPSSALEHFEKAVEKEAQGSLGDSLSLYRKAYRLDSSVDKTYRKKFFPSSTSKPVSNPPAAPVTVPNTAHHPSEEGAAAVLPTAELIASFASLTIPPADPIIEGTPPPPCPIAHLPSEVIIEILRHIAIVDPAMLSRVSLVCKRFAYHVAYEQRVWKRLCQGPEFGFAGMHYSFACDIDGTPHYGVPHCTPFSRGSTLLHPPKPLRTWNQVFQSFPRIRFTGVYISTVNYTRPGAASAAQNVTWGAPIHIVTYYRYLRFYRDGTVISLLTTTEPLEVVPHISMENVLAARSSTSHQHRRHISETNTAASSSMSSTNPVPPVAAATLKYGLRGRWHLISPTDPPTATTTTTTTSSAPSPPDPRDLIIETEGVDPKYTYAMYLTLRSSGNSPSKNPSNGPKNTKLVWKGFWSYNNLTDDWAEFGLRNDRAFVFRRVRGWGMD